MAISTKTIDDYNGYFNLDWKTMGGGAGGGAAIGLGSAIIGALAAGALAAGTTAGRTAGTIPGTTTKPNITDSLPVPTPETEFKDIVGPILTPETEKTPNITDSLPVPTPETEFKDIVGPILTPETEKTPNIADSLPTTTPETKETSNSAYFNPDWLLTPETEKTPNIADSLPTTTPETKETSNSAYFNPDWLLTPETEKTPNIADSLPTTTPETKEIPNLTELIEKLKELTTGTIPGTTAGTIPGTTAGTIPGTTAGTIPGTTAGTIPGTTAGTIAGTIEGTIDMNKNNNNKEEIPNPEIQDKTNENVETAINNTDLLDMLKGLRDEQWAREDAIRTETQQREDTAFSRGIADMRRAGVNVNLVGAQPAQSGGGITNATGVDLGMLETALNNEGQALIAMLNNEFKGDEATKDRIMQGITSAISLTGQIIMAYLFKK